MNFKAHGKMRSNPSFNAKVKMDPLQFETSASASCECEVGRVSAHIGEIGIRFAIPFMKPRRKMPLVASAGEVDAKVACETEMDVEGKFPVKVGRINLDLCEAADLVE